jgi:hypothetical protein
MRHSNERCDGEKSDEDRSHQGDRKDVAMKTVFTRCSFGMLVASLPVALCACPPEDANRTFSGATGAPTVVDTKDYWPMASGNSWLLEDKNWRHATFCIEDYWVGTTEVCRMRVERTDEWGTRKSEYYLLWRDDYVLYVPEASAHNADFLAGLDFVPERLEGAFEGVSILFQRFVDDGAIVKSHENGDNNIYHQTTAIDAVNQLLCGDSAKPISPELYPLPPSTNVLLQRESNTIYCDADSGLPITQIYAKGIGPISRHNLRIHTAIIFDENRDGTEFAYTIYELNGNGFQP